jgi:hypothetical protein
VIPASRGTAFLVSILVTLIVNITLLLTSERKPRWWSVALDVCGLALAASNIAKTERMQKGRHNIG